MTGFLGRVYFGFGVRLMCLEFEGLGVRVGKLHFEGGWMSKYPQYEQKHKKQPQKRDAESFHSMRPRHLPCFGANS